MFYNQSWIKAKLNIFFFFTNTIFNLFDNIRKSIISTYRSVNLMTFIDTISCKYLPNLCFSLCKSGFWECDAVFTHSAILVKTLRKK